MSSPSATANVKGFAFKRNLSLLNQAGSLGFEFSSPLPPDVVQALASDNEAFPRRDIEIGEVRLKASATSPIEFARGNDKISFTASGGAFAGLGIYRTGAALLAKIGDKAEDFSLEALEFATDPQSLLCVLRWGFAAEGKVTGAMALGAVGSATLSVSGNAEGLYAVIRRLPAGTPARTVIQETADTWVLPRQVVSIDQVPPGTWIVAEVLGGISVRMGAQLGYDFNWVREAKLGGLTGSIGLRLQMGINAAVGFSSSARCAVVISRDSDAKDLRLRLFRLKIRQFDVALNADLSLEAVDKFLPEKIDDFIAAVFDTHGQQILSDLKVVEKWTGPEKLSDLLANAGVDGAEKLIAHVAGLKPEELQQNFDRVHDTVVQFIGKWHDLPHRVSSAVLKLVEEKVDLTDVRNVARQLSTITQEPLRSLLETELNRIDFFHTPVGRFLESAADDGVLTLLEKPLSEIQDLGKRATAVLDGDAMEETLTRFQNYVESELHLDRVLNTATDTDFAALDGLLKRRLADFLGQDQLALQDLEKVRKAIRLLLQKRDEYYEKALEALHRKYNFALNATYQSTTTQQALLDATFDFSHDAGTVSTFFQQAVQGKFDQLLMNQPAQVKLGVAKLSHGVKRQAQIDVSLPFMDISNSHLNESVASIEAVSNSGGLLFKLRSSDTVASNQRKSILSLTAALSKSAVKTVGVRLHQEALELNYTLLFAKRDMEIRHVRAQVGPAAQALFKTKIPDLPTFLSFLDRQAEEAIPNGPNRLGNGLISLQVSLSRGTAVNVGQAWLSLPVDRKADVYLDMSNTIQASLKRNVHNSVFVSPEAYTNAISTAHTVLAYCAIVPRAPKNSALPFWDFEDRNERRTMLRIPQTIAKMKELLTRAQQVLKDDSDAQFFRPENTQDILTKVDADSPLLHSLLFSEAEVIKHAFEGGLKIAASVNATPSEAVKAVAMFGAKLTEAFNADITTLLGPGIQALGTQVFLDTSRALDRTRAGEMLETNAMLNLEFLKPSSRFDPAALLAAGRVSEEDLAFADRFIETQLKQ